MNPRDFIFVITKVGAARWRRPRELAAIATQLHVPGYAEYSSGTLKDLIRAKLRNISMETAAGSAARLPGAQARMSQMLNPNLDWRGQPQSFQTTEHLLHATPQQEVALRYAAGKGWRHAEVPGLRHGSGFLAAYPPVTTEPYYHEGGAYAHLHKWPIAAVYPSVVRSTGEAYERLVPGTQKPVETLVRSPEILPTSWMGGTGLEPSRTTDVSKVLPEKLKKWFTNYSQQLKA